MWVYKTIVMTNINDIINSNLNRKIDKQSDLTICQLIEQLRKHGMKVYVAGGAPRDWLLGRSARDIDLSIDGAIGEAYDICSKLFAQQQLVLNKGFGLLIVTGDISEVDINILRDVNDINHSLADVEFLPSGSIEKDYITRDFSINCFYYDCDTKAIENPVKQAKDDLQKNILRLVMSPKKVALDQRICIRILQFMAKGYIPTPETQELLEQRLENDIMTYVDFEQWLKHYITPSLYYFNNFKELALKMAKGQAAHKLQSMFDTM